MRTTVFEQSRLPVATRGDAEAVFLQPRDAADLVDLGERMGTRIVSWHGTSALHVHQFVGAVRVGDLHLEILPKLDGLPGPTQVRQNLLAMLAQTQDLDLRASETVDFLESTEPFVCVLARLYCRRLLEVVRPGLRQEYVPHQDLLAYVRGKVDWPAQATRQATQRLEFSCRFDERSADTAMNRTLKAALLVAESMLEGTRMTGVVTELRHVFSEVTDACPPREVVARLRTDRMNRRLEPLLVLAKLLLGNRNPDLGRSAQGTRGTYALVWDMNVLFEEYVGRVCQQALEPKGFLVDLQKGGSAHLAEETTTGKKAFLLKPDILLRRGRTPCLVADTKWKRLDPRREYLGVSEADVYQVLAYAHRYATGDAILVYPHHAGVGVPGLQREFLIHGTGTPQVRLRVITLDLSRLESVPRQLELGVGALAAVA